MMTPDDFGVRAARRLEDNDEDVAEIVIGAARLIRQKPRVNRHITRVGSTFHLSLGGSWISVISYQRDEDDDSPTWEFRWIQPPSEVEEVEIKMVLW